MSSGDVEKPSVSSDEEVDEALDSVRFNFNIESLGLVLYSSDPKQVSRQEPGNERTSWFRISGSGSASWYLCSEGAGPGSALCLLDLLSDCLSWSLQPSGPKHQENLRLGEFSLHLLKTSGKIQASGNIEVNTVLTACTLDDLRTGMERVTSR